MGVDENQSEEEFDAMAEPDKIEKKQMQIKNSWKLNMQARRQWEVNSGYCGEVSTISALLYFGGYMSQYDMRVNAALTSEKIQSETQYLLGENDQ